MALTRHFVLAPSGHASPPETFHTRSIGGFELSYSEAMPVSVAAEGEHTLALIGTVVDPTTGSPDRWAEAVGTNADSIRRCSQRLTGRYVLISARGDALTIYPDAAASKQLNYHVDRPLVASSLRLLADSTDIERTHRPDVAAFMDSEAFDANQGAMVGDKTLLKGVRRLLPNHVLSVPEMAVRRRPLAPPDAEDVPATITKTLRQSIDAFGARFSLLLGLTAGIDSRAILACSDAARDGLLCYTAADSPTLESADVTVASRVAEAAGVDHSIIIPRPLTPAFRERMATHHYWMREKDHRVIQYYDRHFDARNTAVVSGIGGEVIKGYFDDDAARDAASAAEALHYPDNAFAIGELEAWLPDAREYAQEHDILPEDLLYWEHRLGRWGSRRPLEKDPWITHLAPFCNYDLILTGLQTARAYRAGPEHQLLRDVVGLGDGALVDQPINPRPRWRTLARTVRDRVF